MTVILQALLGKLLFGEALALLWWLGASLILFGLIFLNHAASEQERAAVLKRD